MLFLKYPLYLITFVLFFIYLGNAAPCRKAIQPVRQQNKPLARRVSNINKLIPKPAPKKIDTTLSPKIVKILNQLKNSEALKQKQNYDLLVQKLSQQFHTRKSIVKAPRCSKCAKE